MRPTSAPPITEVDGGRWRDQAACKGEPKATFYPCGKTGNFPPGALDTARAICAGCPVRRECLDYALLNPDTAETGIWGGMTTRQRRNEAARRRGRR